MRLAAVLLLLPALAFGQSTYKCTENGKTVYSERPCGQSAQKLSIGDSAADEARYKEAYKRRMAAEDAAANSEEAAATRAAGAAKADQRRAEPSAKDTKQAYCNKLVSKAKAASDEAETYFTPKYREDAKRRQKEYEDEHFSKCYGTVGTS